MASRFSRFFSGGDGQIRALAAAYVLLGLLLGLLIGWVLWPVEWTDATLDELRPDLQAQYVAAVADAYAATGGQDAATALARLQGFSDPQAAVQRALAHYQASDDPARAIREVNLRRLAAAVGATVAEASTPAGGTAPAAPIQEAQWFDWALILLAGLVLVVGGAWIGVRLYTEASNQGGSATRLGAASPPQRAPTTSGPSFRQASDPSRPVQPAAVQDTPAPPQSWVSPSQAGPAPSEATKVILETDVEFQPPAAPPAIHEESGLPAPRWSAEASAEIERVPPPSILGQEDAPPLSALREEPEEEAAWRTGEWENDLSESVVGEPAASADPVFPAAEEVDALAEDEELATHASEPAKGTEDASTASSPPPADEDGRGFMSMVWGVAQSFRRGAPAHAQEPLARFSPTFRVGIPEYEESFTIEEPGTGKVIGSCGMRANLEVDPDAIHPDQVRVLEVWLYDNRDNRSPRQFIVAPGVDPERLVNAEDNAATVTGEPLEAQPGAEFRILSASFILLCRLERVEVLHPDQPDSPFREVRAELSVYTRSSGS